MKIVHALGWYFPDSLGGTEVYVAALCKHQRARGHAVRIAAPDPESDRESSYEHDGVEVYRYPIPARPTRAEAQGRVPARGADRLHRWLEQERPDVFHCHTLLTGLGLDAINAAKSFGAKVVVTCHTPSLGFLCQRGTMLRWGREVCDGLALPAKCAACDLHNRGLPEPLARLLGATPLSLSRMTARLPGPVGSASGMPALIEHNLERQRRALELSDAFVVLTEWARQALLANHAAESKLVLNRLGVELTGARPARQSGRATLRFGYVGRFDALKGVLVLAEAMARLPPSLAFELELRGPAVGEESERTRARVEALLSADRRVRFAAPAKHASVGSLLAGYDVLVCPSLCLEGGPTVAIEARAVGTPVVGSRIGGLAEIVRDGHDGVLVPPGDAGALARAIVNIVSDPSVLERWRANLPVSRTMEDVTRDYLSLYGVEEATMGLTARHQLEDHDDENRDHR